MAEWWQSPAYNARAAAGLVQTPGLIDMGGVADPISIYSRSGYVAQPRFASQSTAQDPISIYAKSNYTAQPRFASAPSAPMLPNQPSGAVRVAKDNSRLPGDPNPYNGLAFGYDAQPTAPVNPAVRAIDAAAPTGPMFPLQMPRATGTPFRGNYTAAMRFASPNAGAVSDVIDLTAVNPRNPQAMADSQGKPIKVGKAIYYPGGKAPQGGPRASGSTQTQQKPTGLFGGLFSGTATGGLFGSGGSAAPSAFGSSPSQSKAMTVDTNTSTGSTLAGMGFSPGAAVPKATIDNLRDRGYL